MITCILKYMFCSISQKCNIIFYTGEKQPIKLSCLMHIWRNHFFSDLVNSLDFSRSFGVTTDMLYLVRPCIDMIYWFIECYSECYAEPTYTCQAFFAEKENKRFIIINLKLETKFFEKMYLSSQNKNI